MGDWVEEVNGAYQEKLRSMDLPAENADISVLKPRQQEVLRLLVKNKRQEKFAGHT